MMSNLTSILNQLQQERSHLTARLERLDTAMSALSGTSKTGSRKRMMSAASRRKIVAAQKARWAKWRKAQKKS
jgi:hypothetical protein